MRLLLQAAEIDLTTPSATPAQRLLAWVVIALAILAIAYGVYRTYYTGLPRALQDAKADLRGARADTTLQSAYLAVEQARDAATVRRALQAALDGEADGQATLRGAAGSLRRELAATWAPLLVRLPPLARRVIALAAAVVVFGAVAVSTEVLLTLLQTATPGVHPARWPVLAVSETSAVLGRAASAVGALPLAGGATTVLLTVGLTLGTWLYQHWYVSAALLLAAAGLVTWADRRIDDDPSGRWVASLPAPVQVARLGAVAVLGMWAVVLGGIGIGRLAGSPAVGVAYGLYAAGIAGGTAVGLGAAVCWRHRDRIRVAPQRWRQATGRQQTYLLVRAGTLALAAVIGPLVPVYMAVAATKVPTLAAAVIAADLPIQALVALVVVLVGVLLAWQAAAAWGDVRRALRITIALKQVRSVVVLGGAPMLVVAVTYVLVAGLTKSIPIGVGAAVAVGVLVRAGLTLVTRAKYRAVHISRSRPAARRVVLEAAPLTTRDGDRLWYCRVNGDHELLHTDRDVLADDAATVAGALVTDGEAPPTIAESHAEFAFEYGITDPEETVIKLNERARRHLFHELRANGPRVPVDRVAEETEDIPREVVDVEAVASGERPEELADAEASRGTIAVGEEYVELRHDPYSA